MTWYVRQSDAIEFFREMPAQSVDLVFGSPPYMDARTYGIAAERDCQTWVDWMLDVTEAAIHASNGLVLWVVSGVQRKGCYWPGCEGLAWEWWKRGNQLWRPVIWRKVDDNGGGTGIPGSGGKQWLRNDWEYVLAFKREGWLPWADNTACGHAPVYDQVGGEAAQAQGKRQWGDDPWQKRGRGNNLGGRERDGANKLGTAARLARMDVTAGHNADGTLKENGSRPMPKIANPGNFLEFPGVVNARVGGGHMGDRLCHESEAPFPEKLAEFFIRSFCPPGGIVADCFSGSGTTGAVAVRNGRQFLGCDIRQSQVDLSRRRIEEAMVKT